MFYGEAEGTSLEIVDRLLQVYFIGHARVEHLWMGSLYAIYLVINGKRI